MFVFDVLLADEARNAQEARYAASLAGIGEGSRVLDVPCGVGRLTTHLTTLGCDVVGIDLSAPYVARARGRSRLADAGGGGISFAIADMRRLPFGRSFDSVLCWFISLGYYTEKSDRAFLKEVYRCLRPGGSLVIEAVNPVGMVLTRANQSGEFIEETWLNDDLMSLNLKYDPVRGTNEIQRVIIRDGIVTRSTFCVRLYTATELQRLLEDCGFRVKRVVNSVEGPLSVMDERMYIVATSCE